MKNISPMSGRDRRSINCYGLMGLVICILLLSVFGCVHADSNQPAVVIDGNNDEAMAHTANDPLSPIMSISFRTLYAPETYDASGGMNWLWGRLAAPIPPNKVLPFLSLVRITAQYDTNMPKIDKEGFEYQIPNGWYDTQLLFAGVLNPEAATKVGIGISSQFPTGTPPYNGTGQYCLGPAVIVFHQQPTGSQYGVLFQQFNSVGGYSNETVNFSQFQPFFKYYFGTLGVGLSNNNIFTYDWSTSKFTNVPLGVNISKLVHIDKQVFSVFVDGLYNFSDTPLMPRVTTQLGVSWLLPE